MRTIDPKNTPIPEMHQLLVGSVAPRPIAFVSTVSEDGTPNLAPYSFFNVFSSNPPTLVFSSNRKVKGNTTKDTLHNCEATKECVINIVDEYIVHQMGLASIEYSSDVNEFEKSGLTPIPSELIQASRVQESPCQMECKVKQIIPLGEEGGAGNLVVCEVVRMHISQHVFDINDKIDPRKFKQVSRMGRAYYGKTTDDSVFVIAQPVNVIGMGYDKLPKEVLESDLLTAKHLSILAGFPELPSIEGFENEQISFYKKEGNESSLMTLVANTIDDKKAEEAWKMLRLFYNW